MVEEKAAVAMMEIEPSELNRVSEAFGYKLVSTSRLTGGYASSNFAAVLKPPGGAEFTAVLKFSYASMPREEIEHQLMVLSTLERHKFATNYLLPKLAADPDAGLCDRYLVTAEHGGGPWAVLVTFCVGTSGDKMLAAASAPLERTMLESLGTSLARLHAVPWGAAQLSTLRSIRCGYPVCNTGELLRPGEVEAAIQEVTHPFVDFLQARLARFRSLYAASPLPMGFIHGDAFLDNCIFAEDGQLAALVDWEDSCTAPLVLDVAICVSAACFSADNELQQHRCAHVLRGYTAQRTLSDAELAALADFMWAGALACGFYRWREFNISRPESSEETKQAYLIMQQRCELLEATPLDTRAWLA